MKKSLSLAFLFFTGLVVLWWLEYAQIPRGEERLARRERVLTDLFDTRTQEIQGLEIQRGDQTIRFERRGKNQWQMMKPFGAAADPAAIENLLKNLIDLSRSPDVGTLTSSDPTYGLEPPAALVRIDGMRSAKSGQVVTFHAVLEVGNSQREVRFVRPRGETGVEVVDAKLLEAIDQPLAGWREKSLFPVPTFQVVGLTIRTTDSNIEAERNGKGGWTIREPIKAPANASKIESLLAGLSSLKVADGEGGYIANDVKDLSKYGLDRPELSLELKTRVPGESPSIIHLGKAVPDKPDRVFAKTGDQDDVLAIDSKLLSEIPRTQKELRIPKVVDVVPARVGKIEIDSPLLGTKFTLERTLQGWKQSEPINDPVDAQAVQSLIAAIDGLQSSERFETQSAEDPRMSPLSMTIRLWQVVPGKVSSTEPTFESSPAVSLQLGRHDALRKTIYGRLEGDSLVLALPDILVKALPKNRFAFRDRTLPGINLGQVRKLTVKRDAHTFELIPAAAGGPTNQWKLVAPVVGKVDMPTLSQLFASLAQLRAEEFIVETKGGEQDGQFGLDRPAIEIAWEIDEKGEKTSTSGAAKSGLLRVGNHVGRTPARYARLEGLPIIFTLDGATASSFESELYDHSVMNFPADRVEKVLLHWPTRTLTLSRKPSEKGEAVWMPEPETDTTGVDFSQIDSLIGQLARLQTNKYLQYQGIIPVMTGLVTPRLTIELRSANDATRHILRVGKAREDATIYAATGSSETGPVFFLPAVAWNHLIESGQPRNELPDDIFAPMSMQP